MLESLSFLAPEAADDEDDDDEEEEDDDPPSDTDTVNPTIFDAFCAASSLATILIT